MNAKLGRKGRRFLVTLPSDLLERLDAFAKASYRSRNAEVVMRLAASMAYESIDDHGVIVRRVPASGK